MPEDTIIVSASPIPGNEIVVARTIDNLLRKGAHVLHSGNADVHVHGHASREELKVFVRIVRPQFFVPVHGEYRHLVAHADLARTMGVPEDGVFVLEDGDVLEVSAEGGDIVDRFPCGHTFVSGPHLLDEDSDLLRDRQALSKDGIVVVALAVHPATGLLARHPRLRAHGFVEVADAQEMWVEAVQHLMDGLDRDWLLPDQEDELATKARELLGRFLYQRTRRRPTILPVVVPT
jgi:ribonuclease J